MIDYIAKFAYEYVEDESATEEQMIERLEIAEYYLGISFDREDKVKPQYDAMCETCFKLWDNLPVTD